MAQESDALIKPVGGLTEKEWGLILSVFEQHPEISRVTLYGSRAKGNQRKASDIDLVLEGSEELRPGTVAMDLDELPLPYKFDVQALKHISHQPLIDHIKRMGICVFERDKSTT